MRSSLPILMCLVLAACGGKKDDDKAKKGDDKAKQGDDKAQKGDDKAQKGDMTRVQKAKTTEARQFVKKLYDGARMYYMDPSSSAGSMTPLPAQFPDKSVGPTPPPGSCCKGEGGMCAPDATLWTDPVWTALMFSVDDPHNYSYQYSTDDPLTKFTVRAIGDLDCDGEFSTFELVGEINEASPDGPAGDAKLSVTNELE